MLAVIVFAIRERHDQFLASELSRKEITASLSQIRTLLPDAAAVEGSDSPDGGALIRDADGETIGVIVQTAPRANDVVGYSGPNNVLLAFDEDRRLAGLLLLSSGDTKDHVRLVRDDPEFFQSFLGKSWEDLAQSDEFDGVSGATLTSAAIAEGIALRLNGTPPSLRFPQAISVADAAMFFPTAVSIAPNEQSTAWTVANDNGAVLGLLLRTSPKSDSRIGYQGPTDGLLAIDAAGKTVVGIGIKRSYDNNQYVEDTTLDWTFMHRFDRMPLAEFASLSVGVGKDVEGVSGATMTSQTLVENLTEAAAKFLKDREKRTPGTVISAGVVERLWRDLRITSRDVGTTVVVLLAAAIAFTNLRGKQWLRRIWQIVLIGYLGFINADLLSQALFVGWSRSGVPWDFALGLVVLTVAAFAVPLVTKTQLYCHQLCPHGAAQELLRNRLPWRVRISQRWDRILGAIPAFLLLLVLIVALWRLPLDLAGIEPFDAYAVRAAGWATIIIAIIGLVASMFVPMAYCCYGCPTGALLGFLRRNARSDKLTMRDAFAATLMVVAAVLAWG